MKTILFRGSLQAGLVSSQAQQVDTIILGDSTSQASRVSSTHRTQLITGDAGTVASPERNPDGHDDKPLASIARNE